MNAAEDFDKAARGLDGEDVPLSPRQQALADEIARDARRIGPALDVKLPPGVLMRVNARLVEALRARVGAVWRWGQWAAVASAAAAILVAVLLHRPETHATPARPWLSPYRAVAAFLEVPQEDVDVRTQMLGDEIAQNRVDLSLSDDLVTDIGISGLDQDIQRFQMQGEENDFWQE